MGIGSLTPGQKLDVAGTVRTHYFIMSGQVPMLNYVLTATDTSGDTTWSSPGGISGWTITNLTDVYETSGGNVGIGTTITNAGAALSVMNGNVGIGTWKPQGKLDVEGTLSITTFAGNVGIGTWVPGSALNIPYGAITVGQYAAGNASYYGIPMWFSSAYNYSSPPVGGANIFAVTTNDKNNPLGMVFKHTLDDNSNPIMNIVSLFWVIQSAYYISC